MKTRWLIIDGYSLLHHDPAFAAAGRRRRQQARAELVARLGATGAALADRITVVFDGAGFAGERGPPAPAPVEVLFATSAETADSVIERLAHTAPDPATVTVVTSDRAERETVEATGSATIGGTNFLEQLRAAEAALRRSTASLRHRAPKPTLGDFFPR